MTIPSPEPVGDADVNDAWLREFASHVMSGHDALMVQRARLAWSAGLPSPLDPGWVLDPGDDA